VGGGSTTKEVRNKATRNSAKLLLTVPIVS
jgi:hypothetical protein